MKPFLFITLMLLVGMTYNSSYAAKAHDDKHNHEQEQDHQEHSKADDGHEDETRGHKDDHGDKSGHEEELSTKIDPNMAAQVGIEATLPRSQELNQTITSYGSLATGPKQLSHVRARYTGMIKSVKYSIGDYVKRGDLLARVESNESLKVYSILSPIAGTIVQRHANTGEVTQEQVLFSIANFDTLWAEFRIYHVQQAQVSAGHTVNIAVNKHLIAGKIAHIIPAINKPYQLARVQFNNKVHGLSPGLLVEGHIVTGNIPVALAVKKSAIQSMGEQQGVFVQEGDQYKFAPLQLGRSDDAYIEVLSGLDAKQFYVSKNSYLIKADIEKSEAEHEH